jgi:hypothetical protein
METWIRRAVRQRAYRQLWLWAIGAAFIALCFYASRTYWRNFFQGPYQMGADQLAEPSDPNKEFVEITGDKVFPSGIQTVTTQTRNGVKESSYVSSEYYLLVVARTRALIVESKGPPSLTVSGEARPVPAGLVDEIFPKPEDANLKDRVYPFYLSTLDDYKSSGYFGLGCAALYLIAMSYFGRRAWRYVEEPEMHPVVQRVESWSDAMQVAVMSEREMEQAVKFRRSGTTITDNFLIKRGFLGFNLFPLQHLLWAYKKETTQMINFIPVGKTRQAVLVFYGGSVELPSGKKRVDEVLSYVLGKAPWAIAGYSKDLRKAFKKDTRGFCAAVEERRAGLSS